jgi:hypothetical protein
MNRHFRTTERDEEHAPLKQPARYTAKSPNPAVYKGPASHSATHQLLPRSSSFHSLIILLLAHHPFTRSSSFHSLIFSLAHLFSRHLSLAHLLFPQRLKHFVFRITPPHTLESLPSDEHPVFDPTSYPHITSQSQSELDSTSRSFPDSHQVEGESSC